MIARCACRRGWAPAAGHLSVQPPGDQIAQRVLPFAANYEIDETVARISSGTMVGWAPPKTMGSAGARNFRQPGSLAGTGVLHSHAADSQQIKGTLREDGMEILLPVFNHGEVQQTNVVAGFLQYGGEISDAAGKPTGRPRWAFIVGDRITERSWTVWPGLRSRRRNSIGEGLFVRNYFTRIGPNCHYLCPQNL